MSLNILHALMSNTKIVKEALNKGKDWLYCVTIFVEEGRNVWVCSLVVKRNVQCGNLIKEQKAWQFFNRRQKLLW